MVINIIKNKGKTRMSFSEIIKKLFPVLLIFFVLTTTFYQCDSSSKDVVALIDGKPISGEYFLSTRTDRFPEKTLENKSTELQNFYRTVLRAYDADQRDLEKKKQLKFEIYAKQRTIKVQQMYQAYVLDSVITEPMIRSAYENMDERREVRHILIGDNTGQRSRTELTPEEADSLAREVRQMIVKGDLTFAEAAEKYSEGPSADKGGDLGKITWGQMVDAFQQAAWKLDLNTVSEPVRTRFGVHLIQVTGIDSVNLRRYEEEKDRIKRTLQRAKQSEIRDRTQKSLEHIRQATNFSLDRAAIDTVAQRLYLRYQVAENSRDNVQLADLVKDIQYVPVGTMGEGEITAQDLEKVLNVIQYFKFTGIPSKSYIVRRITGELNQEYIAMFAEDYGIKQYKDTEHQLRWAKDQSLDNFYVDHVVLKNFPPGEDTLRAYFEQVKFEKYSEPAEVHVKEIYVTKEDTAKNIRARLDAGADFSLLAEQYNQRPETQSTGGDLGWFQSTRYGPVGEKARVMDKGNIEGPFRVGTGWSIIKLLDRKEGKTSSFKDMRTRVRQDYTQYYRPRLIEQNINQLEEKYNSELYYTFLDTL